jgi:hypothetical protein
MEDAQCAAAAATAAAEAAVTFLISGRGRRLHKQDVLTLAPTAGRAAAAKAELIVLELLSSPLA